MRETQTRGLLKFRKSTVVLIEKLSVCWRIGRLGSYDERLHDLNRSTAHNLIRKMQSELPGL